MGWGPGTPAARPYQKLWQVTPPPLVFHGLFHLLEVPRGAMNEKKARNEIFLPTFGFEPQTFRSSLQFYTIVHIRII